MIGAAIHRTLERSGYGNLIKRAQHPDLREQASVEAFFEKNRPEYVFLAAGKSAGIQGNQRRPADLMLDNLMVTCHVVDSAFTYRAKKLLYLASSCCYPREAPQPMQVRHLMTGPLEPTNEAYATAKIAGIKLCQAYSRQHQAPFISAIPANVFGPEDDFSPDDSHVIGALIRRMHEAKISGASHVDIWGSGDPEREFIFADDLADACVFLMENYDDPAPINIGAASQTCSIRKIAGLIKDVTGYPGELRFDRTKPDGMPRKILDTTALKNLGWAAKTDFRVALSATYDYFLHLQERSREMKPA
jgi:GDP-L-fucose synthase